MRKGFCSYHHHGGKREYNDPVDGHEFNHAALMHFILHSDLESVSAQPLEPSSPGLELLFVGSLVYQLMQRIILLEGIRQLLSRVQLSFVSVKTTDLTWPKFIPLQEYHNHYVISVCTSVSY